MFKVYVLVSFCKFQRGNSCNGSLEDLVSDSNINNSYELITAWIRAFNASNFPLSSGCTRINNQYYISNFKILCGKEPLLSGANMG